MEVYLDNSATTKPRDEVIDEINYMLKECYGNPSSLHRLGLLAERKVENSRENIANFMKIRKDEMFFTSGGTESNNIAIQGIVNKNKRIGDHIVTTKIEHSSVLNVFKHYEKNGFKVSYIDVDKNGLIDLEQLEDVIGDSTILVAIMLVNNEIGTIEPIWEIKKIIKEKDSKALLHVDGIQAFGKVDLDIKSWGIDTFSFSGHKIYGPKGIGGLYMKKDLNLEPIVFGGNQEKGLRSGTENVPGIVGLGKAVEIINRNFKDEKHKVLDLKKYFADRISHEIPDIKINSFLDEKGSPYILNVSFLGVRGEVLLHFLEEKGVYVSTASACASHGSGKSHVLQAIGLNNKEIEGAIRFSFSYQNTKEEIDYATDMLKNSVEEIRKITMR